MPPPSQTTDGPKLTLMGMLVVLLIVGGCIYGAYLMFAGGTMGTKPSSSTAPQPSDTPIAPSATGGAKVSIGVAYGTEKKRWLETAVEQFAQTPEGKNITVNLIGTGSLEAAQSILKGDQKINVWSPASSLYRANLEEGWKADHNGSSPILTEESLALTPMVFVVWEERNLAFERSTGGPMNFKSVGKALATPGGWNEIAKKPEWGLFKFGHTHPNQSNSGLATLALMAYDYKDKSKGLSLADITDPTFARWMADFERSVSGLSNSTGNMMRDMVLKGPSSYDALLVYESVAIDYLKNAEGRWGKLRVVYPRYNLWNENPYYVLDVPWSTPDQRKAADTLLKFLMSEPIQKQSLTHGFRPGNPAVPVKFPESPFVAYESAGLRVDLSGTICETPAPEVIQNLLLAWQRSAGGR